jgi:calcineurin-binding protein cabin-1
MFSITAINDVETSQSHVEHLAPTKEAQESWLTQMYGEALLHLQQGQFVEAQMLFQAILEDPISLKAQIENATGTGPMLQLRFALFLCANTSTSISLTCIALGWKPFEACGLTCSIS